MIIDNGPAIKAFAEQRIKDITRRLPTVGDTIHAEYRARIEELEMVITLADGLEKQNALISNAMARKEVS